MNKRMKLSLLSSREWCSVTKSGNALSKSKPELEQPTCCTWDFFRYLEDEKKEKDGPKVW